MPCWQVRVDVFVTGTVTAHVSAQSISPHEYLSDSPPLQVTLEIIMLLCTFFFAFNELSELLGGLVRNRSMRGKLNSLTEYFFDLKNLMDQLMMTLTLVGAAASWEWRIASRSNGTYLPI